MRITPWMLTMTTFVMVGAIGVLYLFKPPQRIPSGTVPRGASFVNARTYQPPTRDLEVKTQDSAAPRNGQGTEVPSEVSLHGLPPNPEQPYTPQPPVGPQIADVPPDVKEPIGSVEPVDPVEGIDPMFDGQSASDEPRFVTQQFRAGRRIDVTFREGERLEVPRVSSAFENKNQ